VFTLTAIGTVIGTEQGDATAVAIGAENTSGTNTITVPLTLAPSTGNSTIFQAGGGTLLLNQVVSGTGISLTKTGSGTLSLQGVANTFSGGFFINSGLVTFNNKDSLGSGAVTLGTSGGGSATLTTSSGVTSIPNNITVASGSGGTVTLGSTSASDGSYLGTVTLNGDVSLTSATSAGNRLLFSGVLTGSGAVTKIGTGTVSLSNANTYSGGTTVSTGTLWVGSNSVASGGVISTGPVGKGTLTLASGTTLSSSTTTARTLKNNLSLSGSVTLGDATNIGALTIDSVGLATPSTVALTGNTTLTTPSNVNINNAITGAFSLTKAGTGTLTLGGTNTYSGGTTASDGLLQLNNTSALGSTSGSLTVNAASGNAAILDLNGNSISVGNLTGTGGNIWNNGPNAGSSTVTLTIGTGNTGGGNYQGTIADNNGAAPSAKVALIKTGSGTITLSGTNTYTGTTTVNGGGALFINGSTASGSAVTVNGSGTTLGGSGTIAGSVTVSSGTTSNNNLSPGGSGIGSVAKLNTGAVTLNTSTNLNIDITGAGGTGNAGITYDQVSVTGAVNLGGLLASNLVLNVSGLTQSNVGQKFFIVLNDGTDLISTTFAQGTIVTGGANVFTINYADNGDAGTVGNDISLTLTAVPEPSTWIGGALALVAIGFTQRRRIRRLIARRA
jgi:autotransporter-associated beta strand protein